MKKILPIIALIVLPVAGYPSGNASVNFEALKEHLMACYFSNPENAEIQKQFQAAVQAEEKYHAEITKSISEGIPLDIEAPIAVAGASGRYEIERRIDGDLRKELYLIVSSLGLEYDFIYDASDSDAIIYAKAPVDDLTTIVKQAILDRLKEKSQVQGKPDAGKGGAALEKSARQ